MGCWGIGVMETREHHVREATYHPNTLRSPTPQSPNTPIFPMLNRKYVLDNVDLVQANCERRGVKVDVTRFAELETQRRAMQQEVEQLARQANEVSKSIGKAKDDSEREARKEEGRALREQKDAGQVDIDRVAAEADLILRTIPNLSHPDAPIGGQGVLVELIQATPEVLKRSA